jgi:hypothetical protein
MVAPWVEGRPNSAVRAKGSVELRLHGPTALSSLDDATDSARRQPWSLRVTDAWASATGDWLDVRVGVARVVWGVGQGVSVVDELNPWDLSNPTRLDQRLSAPMVDLTLHREAFSLQAVALPFFVPAALPVDTVALNAGADDLFEGATTGTGDITVGELDSRVTLPATTPSSATVGARLRWTGAPADLAISWIHGPDSLPQVAGEVILTGFQTDQGRVDVGVPLQFPVRDLVGASFRSDLPGDIGAWGEASLVLPERTVAVTSERQLEALASLGTIDAVPDPIPQTVTQDGAPYVRSLLGADRAFGPVRITAQWLRGFPTERQASDLRHYGLVAARWTVTPTVRFQVSGAVDPAGPGVLADAELGVLHADAAEFVVGVSHADGAQASPLSGFRGISHARAGVKMTL